VIEFINQSMEGLPMQPESHGQYKRSFILTLLLLFVFALPAAGAPPKNVIILIGDGMGFEQIKAAGMYKNGFSVSLLFESFPHQGQVTTFSADSSITDSAAAATAIATGFKVNNGVVSLATPGNGGELETLLEYFKALGKGTGLVTTTYITHATPACFGAHESSRNNYTAIANDYLNQTRPNVLFGGGGNGMSVSSAQAAGYTVVTDATHMLDLNPETADMVSGQFGNSAIPYELDGVGSLPHLSEMVETALEILDNDPDGFFLMVEGGLIDWACHSNDLPRAVWETIEFDKTVQAVFDWAADRTDTLIIVTADHETGGLTVVKNNGAGSYPTVTWSTDGHTGTNVPVYAWGPNAELISGIMDNTEFFDMVTVDICPGDFDLDEDVDGVDLADLVLGNYSLDLTAFALNFGRPDCSE
jgi:alkaline phosphatase